MTTGLFQAIYSGPGVNPTAYTTGGLFQAMLNMSDHPQQGGCILCVGNQSGTKGTYYLWEDGNTGSISINPFTGILTIGNTVQAPELVLADGGTGTTILNQHQWCGSTQLDSSYFGINSAIGVQTGFDGCAKLNVMIPSSGLSSTGDMNTILRGGNQYNNVGVNLGYTGGASVNTGSANLAILESYISGGDSPDTALISKSTYNLGYVALLAGGVSAATSVMSVRLPSGFLQFSADGMTLNQSAAVTYGSAITGTDSGVFKFGTGAFGNTGAELDFNAMKVGGLTGYVLCPGGTSSVCTASSTIPNTAITGLGTFATQNYASPPAIGSGTPNTGAFTSVAVGASTPANITSTSGNLTLTPSGTGVVSIGSAISWGGGTNITSSSNVPLLGSANAFTQNSTFAGRVSVGSNVATPSADLASLWNDGATATYLDSFGHTTSTYDPIELRVAHSDGSGFVYPLTINYNGITASVPIAAATGSTVNGSTICTTANGACSSGTVSDGAGVTTAGEVAVSTTTAHVLNYVTTLPNGTTATTQAANDNSTELATTAFVQGAVSVTKFFSNVTWSIQPALFSTATMLGPVYFTSYSDTRSWPQLTVRQEGPISCTVAPTVQLMDLGTNASTVYASATAIATLALGTADGVFIGNGSSTLTSDHYYGIAFSAGTCATAPTIDVTVYDTW